MYGVEGRDRQKYKNTTISTAMGMHRDKLTDIHKDSGCYLRCIQGTGVQIALQGHVLPHTFPGSRVGAMFW